MSLMPDVIDIQSAAESIKMADDLVKIQELPLNKSSLNTEDHNGLLEGDVPGGISITGERSFLVQGSINGSDSNPCRIRISGDLVVTGNVCHAQIHCQNLLIGGSSQNSHLITSGDVTVGGDLAYGQLTIGDYESNRHRIQSLQYEITRYRNDREGVERRIHQGEKRIDRACKTTRTPLDFNIKKIVIHQYGHVRIELKSIYASLTDRSQEKAESVLLEFFAKGIVGFLARKNRQYIDNNRACEKVFLQLLRNLRELFMLVAQREHIDTQISCADSQVNQLVDALHSGAQKVSVQGIAMPQTRLEFVQPRVHCLENEELDFSHESASLEIQPGRETGQCQMQLVDLHGECCSQELNNAERKNIAFRLCQDQISWESLPIDKEKVAT
jgi:hypothetical protein